MLNLEYLKNILSGSEQILKSKHNYSMVSETLQTLQKSRKNLPYGTQTLVFPTTPPTNYQYQNVKDYKIAWEIPFKWQITLKQAKNQIACKITSVLSGLCNKSTLNISIQAFNTFKSQPFSYLSKLFHVNPKTLTLIINKGLQGGGVGCCSNRHISYICQTMEHIKLENFNKVPNLNEFNKNASNLATKIKESMRNNSIDKESLKELYKMNIQNIYVPLEIFKDLLLEAPKIILWSSPLYYDERRELSCLLRLYFSCGVLKDPETKPELKSELVSLKEIKKILKSQNFFPESSTILNISLTIKMIKNQNRFLQNWVNKFKKFQEVPFLLYCCNDVIPSDYFTTFLEKYSLLNDWIGSEIYGFRLLWDIIEIKIQTASDLTDELKSSISNKMTQNLEINQKLCILEFIERTIVFNSSNESICDFFVEGLKTILENELENKKIESWKVSERSILVIRSVKNLNNSLISEKLEDLRKYIKEREDNEKVKHLFYICEVNNRRDKKNLLDALEHDMRGIFLRNEYSKKIKEFFFGSIDRIVVTGLTGMGKKALCVKFAIKHINSFDYIFKFNCESPDSLKESLVRYALKLQIEYKTDEDLFISLKKLLLKDPKRSLIIFEKYKSYKTISSFLALGVKSLIVSRKRVDQSLMPDENTEVLELQKLSDHQSIDLLKSLSSSELSNEVLNKLVEICAGWPIAIQIVSAEISILQNDFIKFFDSLGDAIITEDTIINRIESLINELKIESKIILGFARFCANYPIPLELIQKAFDKISINFKSEKLVWWRGISYLKNYYIATIEDNSIRIQEHIHRSLPNSPFINLPVLEKMKFLEKAPDILLESLIESGKLESIFRDDLSNLHLYHAESILKNSKICSLSRFEVAFKLCKLYIDKGEINKLETFVCELDVIQNQNFELSGLKKSEYLIDVALLCCECENFPLKTKIELLIRPYKTKKYEYLCNEYKLKHNEKLASCFAENHRDKDSIYYYLKVLGYQKAINGENSPILALTFKKIAELYEKNEQFVKCKDFYLYAHKNIELNANLYNINLSLLYLSIANAALWSKDLLVAKTFYLKYFEITSETSPDYFKACNKLGDIYFQEKEYDSSFFYLDQARIYNEKNQFLNDLDERKLYLELGECCEFQNEAEKTEFYYKKLLIPEENSKNYREILEKIAVIYEKQSTDSKMDSFYKLKKKSSHYYILLITNLEKSKDPNKNELIFYIEKIIQILSEIQDFESVKNFKIKLIDIIRPLQNYNDLIVKLKDAGKSCIRLNDYEKAYQLYSEALNLLKNLKGTINEDSLKILKKLADVCVNREKKSNKVEELSQFLNIYDENSLYNTLEIAKFIGCLAGCFETEKKMNDAREHYQKAIAILRQLKLRGEKLYRDYLIKVKELS